LVAWPGYFKVISIMLKYIFSEDSAGSVYIECLFNYTPSYIASFDYDRRPICNTVKYKKKE